MTIPKTQVAFGYERGKYEIIRYDDVPVAEPKDNEVLLKIEAAGLCQSDVHILIAQDKNLPPKFIMGHEIAGQIVKAGKAIENDPRYKTGTRYSLSICDTCGVCKQCRRGVESCCEEGQGYGISSDGGFQQYLLVKNLRTLIPIPNGVTYEQAAVATDSILTPFHAINKVRSFLDPTAKVLVMGLGGLGLNALQILRQYGCHIVACDVKPDLQEQAKLYGANEFYTDIAKSSHKPETFDVCFDFCGFKTTFDICQKYIAGNGKLVLVGMGNYKLNFFNYELARREVTVYCNYGGNAGEQLDCLKWVDLGKIQPKTTIADLNDLPHYLKKLAEGKVEGRIVFRTSKL